MLTDRTRKILERALGRSLNADEEAGYRTLAELPPETLASARTIRDASNSVTVSAYLQHVVPSASLDEVRKFMDELDGRLVGSAKSQLTEEDKAVLETMLADRERRMNDWSEHGRPRPLPADSPIFKKWATDPFPGGPEFADPAPQVPNVQAAPREEQNDIEFFLDRLLNGDARDRALSLNALAGRPRADERLLAACERLLEDRTIALLSIPYEFGEVRWVAADAVASMRGLMGHSEAVVIEDVFAPMSAGNVEKLALEAGVAPSARGGVEGDIETLERVAAAGKLPRRRIKREPWVPPRS